ncbi:uncharacterized membrane protein YozB (DUF420 family) [Paenibacillus castaneae]|uniref:DUF2306 domain-containing protein n=1 Tax=Paenibacillus castaneae TaxID=474957 RepID=UPI000C9A3C0D|nr:DUF2306 domain-containing protein [Paenibacillus castaneae]NIK78313.1 uncharacterized membrane protein YozB (DUF420 family) [Paenibacillus castaneae]
MKMLNKKMILPVVYVLAYLLTFYVVIQYIIYKPSQAGAVSSKLQDASFHYEIWKLFFYPHILLGIAALLIGAYQLTKSSRRNPKRHKMLGRIYGVSILINVLVVPYIALYATGGTPTTIAFLVLDVFWLGTTVIGIRHILRKNITAHRQWMLRSYAVTFVFVSFRIVLPIIQLSTDAPMSVTFPLAVYIGIAINLVFTELYLKKRTRNTSKPIEEVA